VTAHLIVALVIVSLLLYATVTAFDVGNPSTFAATASADKSADRGSLGGRWSGLPVVATAALIILTFVQVAIGAQVRGRVDSAIDSAVPRSQALETVGFLDGLHRDTAFIVLVGAVLAGFVVWKRNPDRSAPKRWAAATVALAVVQVGLGVIMAYVALAPAAQVAHLTTASLLLGAEMVLLLLVIKR
jgi:cytochrome c oxidase assembly protein subunit 15